MSSALQLTTEFFVGPHRSSNSNDNTDHIITFLTAAYTISFSQALGSNIWTSIDAHGTLMMALRQMSDHIITWKRDKELFKPCRTFRGAEALANADHVLLVAEL